ncbi:MAG TPA: DUF1947 domain-containing protein [Thermoplasmatales archaeon]|nr:DUF1947 domain-containing protein [Thermoplasmatales archaeon]
MYTIKNRHVLKKRDAKQLREDLANIYRIHIPDKSTIEVGEVEGKKVVIIDNSIDFISHSNTYLFLLHNIAKYDPQTKYVTVDMGAIKFITNGADIMVPGIVDADPNIKENDPVWIKDERHGRAIAVGISLMDGNRLKSEQKGKGIKTVHWVGDRLWKALSKSL